MSKLPHAKKFNLGKYPSGNLRQRFPAPGLGFDGRPSLSEQGFHLLSSLLELCPVSFCPIEWGWVMLWRVLSLPGVPWRREAPVRAPPAVPAPLAVPGASQGDSAAAGPPSPLRLLTALVGSRFPTPCAASPPCCPCCAPQERRMSCEEALDHAWFREHPLPKDRALMPTFPATNDQTQQRYAAARARTSAKGAG